MPEYTDLKKLLWKTRIDKDIMQLDIAKAIGISAAYLSSIESGRKVPTRVTLVKLSQYLNIPLEVLEEAAWFSKTSYRLNVKKSSPQVKEVVALFALKWDTLTDEQLNKIKTIITQ